MDKNSSISVSEFRRNTKLILDATLVEPVFIRRKDDIFKLSYAGEVGFEVMSQSLKETPGETPEVANPKITGDNSLKLTSYAIDTGVDDVPEAPKRTISSILDEINVLGAELDDTDLTNQDPDYWDDINKKKVHVQELWTERHKLKEKE